MPHEPRHLAFDLLPAERQLRLDQILAGRIEDWSRTRLADLVRAGHVRLDGAVARKPGIVPFESHRVEVELVEVASTKPSRFREPVVLYEDEHLVALDKPAGTRTHGNVASGGEASAASWAEEHFGPLPRGPRAPSAPHAAEGGEGVAEAEEDDEELAARAGIVHRLDRDTSGVLLIARTEAAMAELQRQFREREAAKVYAALVHGDPRFDSDWIEGHLGRKPSHPDRISIVPEGEGRFASTYYEVRERYRGFAELAVFPKTGRTHQVRVHMTSIELPLVGEPVYVPKRRQLEKLPPEAPAIRRHALHAARLEITHPASGARIYFEAGWPDDMRELRDWLRTNRPAS